MRRIFDRLWHKALGRPYRLAVTMDTGQGVPVVLLHGIGRSGGVWRYLPEQFAGEAYRLVAFDLLGFGDSPKPDWAKYDIDDHARAIIASIQKLRLGQPAVLVGHSMGCLAAVRVARLRPDLVRHLILFEMPLYEGLPEKRRYRLRLNLYFKLYKRIVEFQPVFTAENKRFVQRLATRVAGLEITQTTWLPFKKSLENTIMQQTASEDIKHIAAPMDVIYGRRDMLVIRGKPLKIFGKDVAERITAHTINARHSISAAACAFIAARIRGAVENGEPEVAAALSKSRV
jgi:pimeloyl-ACP methyl ester carboxylesterase